MLRSLAISGLAIASLCFAMAQPAPPAPSTPAPAKPDDAALLPAGAGKDLIQKNCVACHSIRTIVSVRANAEQWNNTVNQMIEHGATVSDDEADTIVKYLATNFGPSTPKPAADQAAQPDTSH